MKMMFKLELSRAIKSRAMVSAILIGLIITVAHNIQYNTAAINFIKMASKYPKPMYSPPNAFTEWIGASYTAESFLYYLIVPILACIPFADSFFTDKKSGYIKNVLIRANRKDYFIGKYLATFIAAGIAVVIPLIVNLIITSMFLPSYIPNTSTYGQIGQVSMWSKVFFTHPYIYILGYLIIDFMFSGFIATIGLSISLIAEYRFMVIIAPFLIYVFIYSVLGSFNLESYIPLIFLQPYSYKNKFIIILLETVIMFLITASTFLIKGKKEDIY